jgi:hypothetical protein
MTDSPPGPASKAPLVGLFLYLAGLATEAVVGELGSSIFLRLLAPVMVLLGVAIVARAGGPFHRSRIREARWKLWTAWFATAVLLAAYLMLMARASQADGFWITFLTAACLTAAATIALQTTLTSHPDFADILTSLGGQLLAVAFLLLGVAALADGLWFDGVRYVLFGGAFLLLGVAALTDGRPLIAVGSLLAVASFMPFDVGVLAQGDMLFTVPLLMLSIGIVLISVAIGIRRIRLLGAAIMVPGVGTVLLSVAFLSTGYLLYSAAALLSGVTMTLLGGVYLHGGVATTYVRLFHGIGFTSFGSGFLLIGVAMLLGQDLLLGIGTLVFGGAFLLLGVTRLTGHHLRDRLVRVLAHARAPAPPVAERGDDD